MSRKYNVEMILGAVDKASPKLKKVGMAMTAMGAVVVGASAKFLQAASVQEKAENDLVAALTAHGDAVDDVMPKMVDLSKEIQAQTIIGDENALQMMTTIRNLGVMPDKMEEATKGAIGLAKSLNLNADSAARYTALALQGETTILQRYVPALRTATTAAEKQAIVTDLMRKGYEQAQAETETFAGQMAQLKNEAGDLMEELGFALMPIVKNLMGSIRDIVSAVQVWRENNQGLFNTIVATIGVVGALMAVLGPLLIMLPSLAAGFGLVMAAISPLTGAMLVATVAITALVAAYHKLKSAVDEQINATDRAVSKQQELSKMIKSGVDVVKEYGHESKKALVQSGISADEAKQAYQGMFALSAKLSGEDRAEMRRRGELYKEVYEEIADKHIETEEIKKEITEENLNTEMEALRESALEKMELRDFDLQDFIEKNGIKNQELLKFLTDQNAKYEEFDRDKVNHRKKTNDALAALGIQEADAFRDTLSYMSQASQSENKSMVAVGKAASIAQATINTYEAASKALAQGGILGPILMAGVIATGLAQVAKISAVSLDAGGMVTKSGMAEVHKGEVFSGVNNEMGFGKKVIFNIRGNHFVGTGGMDELVDTIKDGIMGDIRMEKSFA